MQEDVHFLHGVGKFKIQAIKEHFLENGISTRKHGNTGKQPKHSLGFKRILGILQFIQNYSEQHAIILPGRIPGFNCDDVKVLPSSDTEKVFLLITHHACIYGTNIHMHTCIPEV